MERLEVSEHVKKSMVANGVPAELAPAVWKALHEAGFKVVCRQTEQPREVNRETVSERVRIVGMNGAFMLGVKVAGGWMVAIETEEKGKRERGAWAFKSGEGLVG